MLAVVEFIDGFSSFGTHKRRKHGDVANWLSFTLLQPELNGIVLHARDYV